jgi:hypothetical protein
LPLPALPLTPPAKEEEDPAVMLIDRASFPAVVLPCPSVRPALDADDDRALPSSFLLLPLP